MSRVSPAIGVETSFPARKVIEVLEQAAKVKGWPQALCVDNGSEFADRELDVWAHEKGIKLIFSRPGKPTDNAMIETFNAKVRAECLNQHWFESLEEAKTLLEMWRRDYNQERPHSSLDNQTPEQFLKSWLRQQTKEKAESSLLS
jgi:putative transposase